MADPDTLVGWARARPWLVLTIALVVIVAATSTFRAVNVRHREKLATALTQGNPQNGPQLLRRYGCSGCHTIPALRGSDGQVGPPLEQLRARVFVAGRLPNTAANLVRFISAPQEMVPGCGMPDTGIQEAEARDVAAYLYTH